MTVGRITKESVEVLKSSTSTGRITKESVEVLKSSTPTGRVTKNSVEVLKASVVTGRVTKTSVEVLYKKAAAPPTPVFSSRNPPPYYLLEGESRALDFHHYQVHDVLTGSGIPGNSGTLLKAEQCLGSGPLYDIWLSSTYPPADSGVDMVQVGDFLVIGEDDDHVYSTPDISWYKYHIEEILTTPTTQSGEFRVRYIKDTENLGDDIPCDLYATYTQGGGPSGVDSPEKKISMVIRKVNVDFLLGN